MKDTDFRLLSAGVEGGGEVFEERVSGDDTVAFKVAASWEVSPFWVLEGAVDFRCDVLVFLEDLVIAGLGVVEVTPVTVSAVGLRFFSLIVSVLGKGWKVGLASFLAYLSFKPSFFQAGICG